MSSDGLSAPALATRPQDAPAVEARGIAKTYRVWASPSARLRALVGESAARALPANSRAAARLREANSRHCRDFAALQPLDFTLHRGEAVAIIGRNGSGKSTLLQIIAGTLQPTEGEVRVRGRVAALLELGSAFHPQMTGRDNVYLYCAILGIPAARVDELFDAIAAFADIDDFIDQPVRTYSSGMVLRLAFAVQTAVAPDILIVDEALAVGDAFFQAKCMRRIRQMVEAGTSLLFVSHAMSTVREVCTRALLLERGALVLDADTGRATQRYLALQIGQQAEREAPRRQGSSAAAAATAAAAPSDDTAWPLTDLLLGVEAFERKAAVERIQNHKAAFVNMQMLDALGRLSENFEFGEAAICRMVIEVHVPLATLWIGFHIRTKSGIDAVHVDSSLADRLDFPFEHGQRYVLDWRLALRLQHGDYYLMCVLAAPNEPGVMHTQWEYIDVVNHAFDFSLRPRIDGMIGGLVAPEVTLDIRRVDPQDAG